jgi:hypothetical protein
LSSWIESSLTTSHPNSAAVMSHLSEFLCDHGASRRAVVDVGRDIWSTQTCRKRFASFGTAAALHVMGLTRQHHEHQYMQLQSKQSSFT